MLSLQIFFPFFVVLADNLQVKFLAPRLLEKTNVLKGDQKISNCLDAE